MSENWLFFHILAISCKSFLLFLRSANHNNSFDITCHTFGQFFFKLQISNVNNDDMKNCSHLRI